MSKTIVRRKQFALGVEGFEKITPKLLPDKFWIALVGPPGSFKTVMCICAMEYHMKKGVKCLYIATESEIAHITDQAKSFNFKWQERITNGDLVIVDWQLHLEETLKESDRQSSPHLNFTELIINKRKQMGGIATINAMLVIDSVVTLWEDRAVMASKFFRYIRRRLQHLFNMAIVTSQMASSTKRAYGAGIEHIVDGILRTGSYFENGEMKTYLICVKLRERKVNRVLLLMEVNSSGVKITDQIQMSGRVANVYDAFSTQAVSNPSPPSSEPK